MRPGDEVGCPGLGLLRTATRFAIGGHGLRPDDGISSYVSSALTDQEPSTVTQTVLTDTSVQAITVQAVMMISCCTINGSLLRLLCYTSILLTIGLLHKKRINNNDNNNGMTFRALMEEACDVDGGGVAHPALANGWNTGCSSNF